ncbi:MAG: M16 family metallopeptidase [Rhodothermales bacterium]
MRFLTQFLALVLFSVPVFAQETNPVATPEAEKSPIDIPYEKFVLDNGLTVIVHQDDKAPIVAVNLWYHVGSKNEKAGKTGFAHLFEHLMFNGSENFNDDYFQVLEKVGATDLNGTTNQDRTNYFQNVPVNALDLALWMESDRMGHLVGAIDQDKLDEQRGVVQNEKRQGENQPYGKVYSTIIENTYPKGHPYSWSVIGSMDDLNAAALEDVHEWFKTYYGPNNATLVIAGDIDPATAREKVEKYFGDIEPGPPISKQQAWVAKRSGETRMTMEDRVPQARIYKVWNIPERGDIDLRHLDLVSDVLGSGKTSRLYERLVYRDQIATDASAFISQGEIGSQFQIRATARPGVDLATVEAAVKEELHRLLEEGIEENELRRIKTQYVARFIRGAERIGGFGGKSDILAQNEVYADTPDFYQVGLERVRRATAEDLLQAAREWLSDGVFSLEVHPYPELMASGEGIDRSSLPVVADPPNAVFPQMQKTTLKNGLEIVLVERDAVPVVNFRMIFDAGYAADQFAKPGTASLAMNMLDEGTKNRDALQISEELALLGATVGAFSSLDASSVSLSALKSELDKSLDLYADVVLNPAFPSEDFDRLKQEQLVRIQREQVTPVQMALRVFPGLLYGGDHAYGLPLTGSGTTESVTSLERDDLAKFHQTWFKPDNATLIVVGDVSMDELKPKLEKAFSKWKKGSVPQKNISQVAHQEGSSVYIMDRPGAQQSIIFAGHIAPPKGNPNEIAIETMNTILGGAFISRVNMNLREDKGWSYGAQSLIWDAKGQRPFLVYAPVQTDKTKESMQEVSMELKGILGDKPVTPEEVDRAKKNQTLTLAGRWETNGAVMSSVAEIVQYGLPEDYNDTYTAQVRGLSIDKISDAAEAVLEPEKLVWVIVGDRAKIEAGIREMGLGTIYLLDEKGNVMKDDM